MNRWVKRVDRTQKYDLDNCKLYVINIAGDLML